MQSGSIRDLVIAVATLLWVIGCDRANPPVRAHASPTVASLVPAATDLIFGMNAENHLVAVSNYDVASPAIEGLPRVGDYRNIDWEKIVAVKPRKMIVQFAPEKMPAGLKDQCGRLSIGLINVHINRLDDVFTTLQQLGPAIGEDAKADVAARSLRETLDQVRNSVKDLPRVATLIAYGSATSGISCVGPGGFLDDVLQLAGGTNALGSDAGNAYPTIDTERLLSLNPQAILVLLPGEPMQVQSTVHDFWAGQKSLRAVREGQVYFLTDSYLLLPGFSVGRIARNFAAKLHPTVPSVRAAGHG